MSISLTKGERVSLTKAATDANVSLSTRLVVGCGWDTNKGTGLDYDLDLVAAALDISGKSPSYQWFVYYGNPDAPNKVIQHSGDNLTGEGDGDDESVTMILDQVPDTIECIVIAVNIYMAYAKKQNFGEVQNAFVRIYDSVTNRELVRYDLGNDFSHETLVVFGELFRTRDGWGFKAVGEGIAHRKFTEKYGVMHF